MRQWMTIGLALAGGLAAAGAPAAGPGVLKFDETSFEVVEEAGVAVITVERSNGEDGAVSVSYSASAGTATAGLDFTPASGTLSWGAGDGTNRTFEVPIAEDSAPEGQETIALALANPTGGAAIDALRGTSTLVILSSDGGDGGGGGGGGGGGAGTLKFDESDFWVTEGLGQAVISVERSNGEDGAVSVAYRTENGTATAGSDFTSTSGVLAWGSGDGSTKTFVVPIVRDELGEPSEDLALVLANPTGGATVDAVRGTARLHIQDDDNGAPPSDDDDPGVLRFDPVSVVGREGGSAIVSVERSRGEGGTVSVLYATSDGSARAGSDYTPVSGTLTWGPGDGGVKTFAVPLLLDGVTEGGETVQLRLSNPTGGATVDVDRGAATLQVMDLDGSRTACDDSGTALCLVGGRFKVELSWRTAQGGLGVGHGTRLSDNSGTFWFFDAGNTEVLLKVLDACSLNGRFWVFYAATTDVGFNIEVTDTARGVTREYSNSLGLPATTVTDTGSFATCN